MKYHLLILFLVTVYNATAQAGKCKTDKDKDTKREYYTIADITPNSPYGFEALEFIHANFRLPEKQFRKKDKISFAFLVEPDGTLTFLKMLSFKDDTFITDEAKRIVSLMPKYGAAYCGKTKVPYYLDITFAVDWLKKER
jgi:hypothetical protein